MVCIVCKQQYELLFGKVFKRIIFRNFAVKNKHFPVILCDTQLKENISDLLLFLMIAACLPVERKE